VTRLNGRWENGWKNHRMTDYKSVTNLSSRICFLNNEKLISNRILTQGFIRHLQILYIYKGPFGFMISKSVI
jgi:hypothetical protein